MAKCDNYQQQSPGQTNEIGTQIDLGNEVLRLFALRTVRPRFFDIEPQFISFFRSRMVMGQTAPSHLCIKCNGSFRQQVSAITRKVQEFFIAQACISFIKARVQDVPRVQG